MKSSLIRINVIFILLVLFIPNLVSAETQTFIKEYTYQASEADSKLSSRTIALEQVKRLLLEELGTYLESITEVANFRLTKDKITTLTAGIVQTEIVDEKWDGKTYWLEAKIEADSDDVVKSIDNLRKDRTKTKELEKVRKRADKLLTENAKLRKELEVAKGEKKRQGIVAYEKTIKELTEVEWFEKGLVYALSGDYSNAIDAFTKVIEFNPKDTFAYSNRGLSYSNLGNYRRAIEDYDKAIELNPKIASTYHKRGTAYDRLGNYRQSIEDFDRAIKLNPKDATSYNNRGTAYGQLGEYRRAIEDFDRAIKLNPKDAGAYVNRGKAYAALGNNRQALDNVITAARLGDKSAQDLLKSQGIEW